MGKHDHYAKYLFFMFLKVLYANSVWNNAIQYSLTVFVSFLAGWFGLVYQNVFVLFSLYVLTFCPFFFFFGFVSRMV